jgi:hypothetical protein
MEPQSNKKRRHSLYNYRASLCSLPKDVIELIIGFYPCPQWFTLCKQLTPWAYRVISPLDYRNKERGSFVWASAYNKVFVVRSLLQDTRIDPAADNNCAIRVACRWNSIEVIQVLLQGTLRFYRININQYQKVLYLFKIVLKIKDCFL